MKDRTNPIYDKEMRSEIFGQGTLMLRLAIQISMILAIPLMAVFLYIYRSMAPWYISYVCVFNILVGPVFSAGSVTSERERQTLDLLLTTIITPWQFLWGKLLSGLRVSSVLTSFLLWPLLLALIMVPEYWSNIPTVAAYLIIFALTCITTAVLALFCSTVFRKTSTSLIVTYLAILFLYVAPLASSFFTKNYFPDSPATPYVEYATISSPFAAAFNFPIYMDDLSESESQWSRANSKSSGQIMGYPISDMKHFLGYVFFTILLNGILLQSMIWLFGSRWRVAASNN